MHTESTSNRYQVDRLGITMSTEYRFERQLDISLRRYSTPAPPIIFFMFEETRRNVASALDLLVARCLIKIRKGAKSKARGDDANGFIVVSDRARRIRTLKRTKAKVNSVITFTYFHDARTRTQNVRASQWVALWACLRRFPR